MNSVDALVASWASLQARCDAPLNGNMYVCTRAKAHDEWMYLQLAPQVSVSPYPFPLIQEPNWVSLHLNTRGLVDFVTPGLQNASCPSFFCFQTEYRRIKTTALDSVGFRQVDSELTRVLVCPSPNRRFLPPAPSRLVFSQILVTHRI
jgi:hypothetical protein